MKLNQIIPLNNRLVVMKLGYEGLILLGSDRNLTSVQRGIILSDKANPRVLYSAGGEKLDLEDEGLQEANISIIDEQQVIQMDGVLRKPYIWVRPEEIRYSKLIDIPEAYFSGVYEVVKTFPGCELQPGDKIHLMPYAPTLECTDHTEFIAEEGVALRIRKD